MGAPCGQTGHIAHPPTHPPSGCRRPDPSTWHTREDTLTLNLNSPSHLHAGQRGMFLGMFGRMFAAHISDRAVEVNH